MMCRTHHGGCAHEQYRGGGWEERSAQNSARLVNCNRRKFTPLHRSSVDVLHEATFSSGVDATGGRIVLIACRYSGAA